MTAESASINSENSVVNAAAPGQIRQGFDAWLERASEHLNPILVKESRQELKSRQFSLTFALLLVAGWCWSMFCITSLSPAIYFAPAGPTLLYGYYLILSIPMMIIIPFSAFRSLAVEREDGTFELLSITTLNARQIVTGKLGSAVLQMIVYYSALSPCLAFTYLLRGIDILTIVFVLAWTFLISIALAIIGLLCATITRAKHWQSVLAVVVILGLATATVVWDVGVYAIVFEGGNIPFDDLEFVLVMAALLTALVSFSVLFLLSAASRISFASDNASTRLRVTMLVQQVLFCGWVVFFAIAVDAQESLYLATILAAIYWSVAGAIMCGESSKMSPRVQRQLPKSYFGRLFLTWYYPGSGTGYFFAVSNLLTTLGVVVIVGLGTMAMKQTARVPTSLDWVWFAGFTWCYVALYLGVGRILYLSARRFNPESLLLSSLLQFFLAVLGAAIPWLLQSWISGFEAVDYTPMQFTNWIWTLREVAFHGVSLDTEASLFLVLFFLAVVLLVNLHTTAREIDRVRMATPQRILEDERELHPEKIEQKQRLSPWDEEPRDT